MADRRILMTADPIGGVWQYALTLCRHWQGSGVRVLLASMGQPLSPSQEREVGELCNVEMVQSPLRLEWMDDPWCDVDAAARWLAELAKRFRPDHVHLNGYAHAVIDFEAPVTVVAHSCVCSWWRAVKAEPAPPRYDEYRQRVRAGLEAARTVVAPSRAMAFALAEEYGIDREICVIPNGLDLATRPATKLPILFAAGRLWDEAKNLGALARIAPRLRWPVFLAGDGGEAYADTPNLTCLGRLSWAETQAWQARAALYCLPALYEPFGLSILEAAAHRCHLVLGDIDSLRENWSGEATFVEPRDEEALLSTLHQVIDGITTDHTLSHDHSARVSAFSARSMASRYLTLQDALIGERVR